MLVSPSRENSISIPVLRGTFVASWRGMVDVNWKRTVVWNAHVMSSRPWADRRRVYRLLYDSGIAGVMLNVLSA